MVVVVAFSSPARILGKVLRFIPRLRFFLLLFFFSKVEISSRTPIPRVGGQDESTLAQRAETTVAECFRTSCLSAHSDFVSFKREYVFRCNLPPALLAE